MSVREQAQSFAIGAGIVGGAFIAAASSSPLFLAAGTAVSTAAVVGMTKHSHKPYSFLAGQFVAAVVGMAVVLGQLQSLKPDVPVETPSSQIFLQGDCKDVTVEKLPSSTRISVPKNCTLGP